MSYIRKNAKDGLVDIKVVGIGGGGINVLNTLIKMGLENADFIAMDTDAEKLASSLASKKILIGENIFGVDSNVEGPFIGEQAAKESYGDIAEAIRGADMVIILACMGGNTGTGAAPIVASCAREIGALTFSITAKPLSLEGTKRCNTADEGMDILKKQADVSIIVVNERVWSIIDDNATTNDVFVFANVAISQIVRSITNYTKPSDIINMDFACMRSMLKGTGRAIIGMGEAIGENAILTATKNAMEPFGGECMQDAGVILMNVMGNTPNLMDLREASEVVREAAYRKAEIICNVVEDKTMDDKVIVTLLATKFGDDID
ncbi:putative cell division protein FtsZ [Selenomonas ruminantium subsp. lactilytica TAM6421]|uniref:Cell division protein FtsZ n=1 Tax=Selenomonas ruminantium subsp. lactilytica (strain NBRC 103574 / TAM6421) TaxID=927704 RepID=I0GQP0_SELRL|nr:cell division protein FtsZ [Selenomonas ruminantium]BAL83077.1 putative cell division protein FtsZ [Selenomonas ruminantium subsp. lactilytica TAM6421]